MSNPYVGWVPTVLGNLSFQLMGHSGYPFPFFRKICEKKGDIEVVCLQKRIPFDYQIPTLIPIPDKLYLKICSFVAQKYENENIESAYLLLAKGVKDETGTVQVLKGKIYRVFKKDNSEQKRCFDELSCSIESELTTIKTSENNEISLKEYIKKESFLCCDFTLNRQGICELDNLKSLEDEDNCWDDKITKQLLNQSFYFIKDAYHSHKHHNRSEDTLISAYPKKDDNNILWSEHILKELYRYLIRQRPTFEKTSMGIFPYIRTFCKIIDPKSNSKAKDKKTLNDRTVALDELENSISISIESFGEKLTHRRWFVGITLAIIQMTFFYIFSSNVDLYKGAVQNNTTAIIMLALITLPVLFSITKIINLPAWRTTITTSNLIISKFDKNQAVTNTALCGLIFILLGLFIAIL